jgi:hypothetical protein
MNAFPINQIQEGKVLIFSNLIDPTKFSINKNTGVYLCQYGEVVTFIITALQDIYEQSVYELSIFLDDGSTIFTTINPNLINPCSGLTMNKGDIVTITTTMNNHKLMIANNYG